MRRDPCLRQHETVAGKLSSSPGFLRRGRKPWMTLGIGLLLVLGFWFVLFPTAWVPGSATGVSGFLETVLSSGSETHAGTVTISRDGVVEETAEATTEEGFSVEIGPGTYELAGTTADGGSCFSQVVEIAQRGFTKVTITCRHP